ncbi:MAG: hypothetical protein UW46_C0002G0021 [Candidatus Yanofskybacteria bacterium GW2011_GWF1_44_227]|uniref:Uncharacterized protein n=1 Tax=Candidatus Yanofskybacteria bacterium GW2011_GWE2_40_11 TaxID=1619033 RepID=A0A0G0QJY3_9BACT|nr:MAG: hypothetical protein UT69_C0017G0016 [Candidatus Yanofskybacteria bacterium GW2011_GWE1_40_10]KKR40664.1 MAG: hypothetical protein UT75_C0006G0043 [Candidatus Yanofskybacteria bacterium GW2011_GWE2_40_11]KKT15775.1 MAG: hypothetical protein UV97_C0002G0021 [Candidatus Yanofskybacteria bacterium GW2011_GWF2_43_596]KKT53465.1 MAG: hypothetical protein UW46_C0002G0021 [Candidatus Yanofskybacteria bacterium GW2011_GWF1_44_227]OGN35874.1 MAG: hypothetical protein A2241_03785 [Candidatus Yano
MRLKLASKNNQGGFALIDILVAITIIAAMSGLLLSNFSKTRLNLNESAGILVAAIRAAEVKTTSSTTYEDAHRCGFGLRVYDTKSVALYAGPTTNNPSDCGDKKFDADLGYKIIENIKLIDLRVEIKREVPPAEDLDVFFTPPEPKTCINGIDELLGTCPANRSGRLVIGKIDEDCTSSLCKTICVYGTGRIETYDDSISCP